ncbi:hypothetical protein NFC81_14985 [Salinispirillum sp. LH 10-3-1]|uniref:Transporter substrate-binding domain-containing protein n=1 Tax=Salinispirillum sp. LH 10-3-1 TaxID=2952525 RepID=A0AB38YFI3_9GAMM
MRKITLKLLIFALSTTVLLSTAAANNNTILVPPDVLRDYRILVGDRDPLTITDYSGPGSRRDVVELILMQQAIAAAGVHFDLTFVEEADYAATLNALSNGSALASGTSAWLNDLSPRHQDIYITTALIGRGEFEAGFYVHPDNLTALTASNTQDVQQLTGISSRHWQADWNTLSGLQLDALLHSDTWPGMVDAVMNGGADFLLAPFQTSEAMQLSVDSGVLVPIPGIKLGLVGSRHMAISRRHAEGPFFNSVVHLGLLRLKKSGTVRQAYIDAGFLHPDVEDWTLITVEGGGSAWSMN